jgi:RimJ/RimL family protein N-acetyltransferase
MHTARGTTAQLVAQLRSTPRIGRVVDLLPYCEAHHSAIIALRNNARASYFLHQPAPLTLESQSRWYAAYLERDDDVQWVIARKDGEIVGGTALYGIAADRLRGEKVRLVIDECHALEAPYALEAELLLLDTAFQILALSRVDTCVRHDNTAMQSINARLGFLRVGAHVIRGVDYHDFSLATGAHAPWKLRATLDAWTRRRSLALTNE